MKLSIVLSTQPAAFSALAYKGQLAENIAKIKRFGYDGVELAVRDPGLLQMEELEALLGKYSLPVPAIGTGQAYGEDGLSFTHVDSTIRCQAIDRVKSHIALADRLGAVVIIGLIRGQNVKEAGVINAEAWLVEAMRECAATNPGVKLAIEPINRYETDIINSVEEGMRFFDKVDSDNVGFLLDTFHMNIEEASISDSIKLAGNRVFHFHIADSNRWYPGAGHTDFEDVLAALESIRYNGFLSAEILPNPDADTAAKKTIENMRILEKILTRNRREI